MANTGSNTVSWNGAIAAGASVTITIDALIDTGLSAGIAISNQGTVQFDADGNGTNESTASTDDAAVGGAGDATIFQIAAPEVPIPTLSPTLLAALALMFATIGLMTLRNTQSPLRARATRRN